MALVRFIGLTLLVMAISAQVLESEPQPQGVILPLQDPASVPQLFPLPAQDYGQILEAQIEYDQAKLAVEQAMLSSFADSPQDGPSEEEEQDDQEDDQSDDDADQDGENTFYKKYDWKKHTEAKKKAWICFWKPWKC